jgi:hypothetical protein
VRIGVNEDAAQLSDPCVIIAGVSHGSIPKQQIV